MTRDLVEFAMFKAFAVEHKRSGDIDPVYPVLREVHKIRDYSFEEATWHTLLYITWYHLGSCETVMKRYPKRSNIPRQPGPLRTGIERRGFRGNERGVAMINALLDNLASRSFTDWLMSCCEITETTGQHYAKERWKRLARDFVSVRGNGVWAGYKWCDLVKNVLAFPITAPDIGFGGMGRMAGPVPGLVRLTGQDWKRCALDVDLQERFYEFCLCEGIPWDGLEEMETALCDFNTYRKGHYYVGHDIDLMMEQIAGIPGENDYWNARSRIFPKEYLGEEGGWFGLRKERMNGASHRGRGCPRKW